MILHQVKEFHRLYSHWDVPTEILLGITPRIEYDRVKRSIRRGKWSVLTFSSDPAKTAMYGMKILPWLPGSKWPVVYTMPYMQSVTEFPNITSYITGLHWEFLNRKRRRCEDYLQNWDKRYEIMLPVYRLFGGADDLDDLKNFVLDPNAWPAETISAEEIIQRRKTHSLKIEPSEANAYLLDLLDKAREDDFLPEIPTMDLGIWSDRIRSILAARAYMHAFNVDFSTVEHLLLQAVFFSHGFDTEDMYPTYNPSGSETSNFILNPIDVLCASYNKRSKEVEESIEYSIAVAMNEKQNGYSGTAHVKAAALFDEQQNDPKKAWTALVSAGYWAGKNMPEAQETILKAAIYLCEKHQWDEAAETLQYHLEILL